MTHADTPPTDIVTRLRTQQGDWAIAYEAADVIAELRQEIERLKKARDCEADNCDTVIKAYTNDIERLRADAERVFRAVDRYRGGMMSFLKIVDAIKSFRAKHGASGMTR